MNVSGDDMDNWMANRMDDVDSLHVEIDNLNDPLVVFCFIRDIYIYICMFSMARLASLRKNRVATT
jgi:hypothetical protein